MSQPYKRGASVPAPGKVDKSIGEFWVENPWDIVEKGHNLSSYERKRTFLSVKGKDFLDISALTGADGDGDGRAVVVADFNHDGKLDLLLRQVGGGALLLYENQFPDQHFLEVRLRGKKSNRLGIGARVRAIVGDHQVVRSLYPANTFRSQMPALVHLGLGAASKVDTLRIEWPSGTVQELKGAAADQRILVEEGNDRIEPITLGETIAP